MAGGRSLEILGVRAAGCLHVPRCLDWIGDWYSCLHGWLIFDGYMEVNIRYIPYMDPMNMYNIYTYVCILLTSWIYTIDLSIHISIYIYMYISIYIYMYIAIQCYLQKVIVNIFVLWTMDMRIFMHLHIMHIYIHIYPCICIHMYICLYIPESIPRCSMEWMSTHTFDFSWRLILANIPGM